MSYKRSLAIILKDKDPKLYNRLEQIEEKAKGLLAYTTGGFPYYTPHSFELHSKSVEEILNWLIPDNVKENMALNEWEIFFLIIAAWLHDWGMVCQPGEIPSAVRESHHKRTEENFETLHDKLGLTEAEARIIGRIARGHRKEDLREGKFDDQFFANNIRIRIRFLTAALRLADECDITHNRVPELIYYSVNPKGASKEYFERHLSIGGIGKRTEYKIGFDAVARDPKGAEALEKLRDKIQEEVDNVKVILASYGIPIEYVEVKIDARGFVNKPIAFTLDQAAVTQLLIGEELYSREDVAIRELLQNSVDACRLQKNIHLRENLHIRIYKEENQLVVEDNGTGMDFETALNFLSKKGLSYYRSQEFKSIQAGLDFDPISRWGLGILSCFLIASNFLIETQMEGKAPCKFTITSVEEGWRYEELASRNAGTKIVLTLNEEGSKMDLERVVRHYVKWSPIPIFLGKATETPMAFDWTNDDEDIKTAIKKLQSNIALEGSLARLQKVRELDTDEIWLRQYYTGSGYHPDLMFLANQGFFIDGMPPYSLPIPIPSQSIVLLNLKKDLLDLNVARDNLRGDTPKFRAFEERWLQMLIDWLQQDYKKALDTNPKPNETNKLIRYHLLTRNYSLEIEDYVDRRKRSNTLDTIPKAYFDFAFHKVPYAVVATGKLEVETMAQIEALGPKQIKVYLINVNYGAPYAREPPTRLFEAEFQFVESQLREGLSNSCILLFVPYSSYRSPDQVRPLHDWMMASEFSKSVNIEHVDLRQIIASMSTREAKTPLDSLLPAGSSFAHLPESLHGGVICLRPFVVRMKERVSLMDSSHVFTLITRELLRLPRVRECDNYEIVEGGKLLIDDADEIIIGMINNHEKCMSDASSKQIVSDYLGALVSEFISPSTTAADFLEIKEREVMSLVGIDSAVVRPRRDRRGPMYTVILSAQSKDRISSNLAIRFQNADEIANLLDDE